MPFPQPFGAVRGAIPCSRDPDALVDTKTAARLLGLRNHHTLEVWRSSNRHPELRYHKVGRAIRYRTRDIERFLDSNAVGDGGRSADAETRRGAK